MKNPFDPFMSDDQKQINHLYEKTIKEIEEKHIEYFKERESSRPNQEHDRLGNHFALYKNRQQFSWRQEDFSDLDKDIANETKTALSEALGKQR